MKIFSECKFNLESNRNKIVTNINNKLCEEPQSCRDCMVKPLLGETLPLGAGDPQWVRNSSSGVPLYLLCPMPTSSVPACPSIAKGQEERSGTYTKTTPKSDGDSSLHIPVSKPPQGLQSSKMTSTAVTREKLGFVRTFKGNYS
ncbi:hypothetical protein Avbf_00904 [Armadillidium vulgare]|nr:hypothetical protein Avbf_00904 [Armadillidium vulgare]